MKTRILLILAAIFISSYVYAQQKEATSFTTKSPKETFIGAVMLPETINKDAHQFVNITVPEQIKISSNIPNKSREIIPSYDGMMEVVKQWVSTKPSQAQSSFSYSIKPISSFDELNWYFGQKINPSSFFNLPETGSFEEPTVILSISQVFFSVNMDFPYNGRLFPNDPKIIENGDKMIYVNEVSFGRKAIVLVHTTMGYQAVKKALEESLSSDTSDLSPESRSVLANANIEIMVLGNPNLEKSDIKNPLKAIGDYFRRPVSTSDFGLPISFSAAYIKDNSLFSNVY